MDKIKIREMTILDYEPVMELWTKTNGIGLSEADSIENISRYLDRNFGLSLVAEKGELIVGAVLCGHDGRRGYIHHLAVDEKYQMNGIGKSIMIECLNRLKKVRISKCHLFVFEDNVEGIKFWKALGWIKREELNLMSLNIK